MKYHNFAIGIIASALYVYLYTAVRTTRFGYSLKESVAFFFAMVAVTILFSAIQRNRMTKKKAAMIVGVVFVLTLIGEAYAGAQEWRVLAAHGRDCKVGTYIERWTPFSNHGIYCGETGTWIGND